MKILITSKARQLLKLVPEDLKKPELTARWGAAAVPDGKGRAEAGRVYEEDSGIRQRSDPGESGQRKGSSATKISPQDLPPLRQTAAGGKRKKTRSLLVCQDRECGYRETVSRTTNARCPVCHKRMELVGKRRKRHVCLRLRP